MAARQAAGKDEGRRERFDWNAGNPRFRQFDRRDLIRADARLLTDGGSTKAIESNQPSGRIMKQDMEQVIIPDFHASQSI